MIGILSRQGPPDEALVRRALAAVPYPTPDQQLRRVGSAVVGIATRPDFVDESISVPGAMVAALSGRLDNARELYAELTAAGTRPESEGDADIVVAALRAHGIGAVERFRGAFAGVATDGNTLWLFRDHVGFKALFYRDSTEACIAAGEARQVVVAAGIPEEPDLRVVEAIYFGGMPSNTPAALKGVQRVAQAGHLVVPRTGEIVRTRYWAPWARFESLRLTVPEAEERFRQLLQQAVARTMVGDDCLFLSGGLDSPAIAAYAAPEHVRRTGRPLGALSSVFPDLPDVDEGPVIQRVAERFGITLHTYRPQARALDDVERWSRDFGTPVPTLSIPEVWDAYSRARALGYRNVLTGEFAELTYGKFPHLLSHLLLHGRLGALLGLIRSEHARGASRSELLRDALSGLVPSAVAGWFAVRQGQDPSRYAPSWLRVGETPALTARPDLRPPGRHRYRALQMWGFEGCTVTMEADATCAAMAGVTIRRPFADVDLWEFFMALPGEVKFPTLQWKALARQSLRGVIPDEILDRLKKTYFDPHVMQQVDYPELERLLGAPALRIAGVDYDEVARRIRARDLSFSDWLSLRELARVHAFLAAYERP